MIFLIFKSSSKLELPAKFMKFIFRMHSGIFSRILNITELTLIMIFEPFTENSKIGNFSEFTLVIVYNLNVTEILDSDFKNAFPGIFNFTVGILTVKLTSRLGHIVCSTVHIEMVSSDP